MAVKMRLTRMGDKKSPFYRIVVVDSRKARDGEYIEKVGHYNPTSQPEEIVIDEAKARGEGERLALQGRSADRYGQDPAHPPGHHGKADQAFRSPHQDQEKEVSDRGRGKCWNL